MHTRSMIACACLVLAGCATGGVEETRPLRALSDVVVKGLVFPESVGCDAREGVIYVSQFGGTELKPGEKDGKGFISKLSLDGKVLEERAFNEHFHKPKGIWIARNRLWVTDIDSVWVFDTKSKRGRKLAIRGARFANDLAVRASVLYVSDNRSDALFRVEPADFLDTRVPIQVMPAWIEKQVNPNGLWPLQSGNLLVGGFLAADKPRGLYSMQNDGDLTPLGPPLGRIDGVLEMADGSLLVTEWNSGSLARWTPKGGMEVLARDFKGPADFCMIGDTVFVPDLVKSELRIIKLGR